jgi:hypothetical protein
MVVNTSVEHMRYDDWFKNIPSGMIVGLQGTNMVHEDEDVPNPILSMDHLLKRYPLVIGRLPSYQRVLDFQYPGKEPFSRFHVVGRKP